MKCKNCGAPLNGRKCHYCGQKYSRADIRNAEKADSNPQQAYGNDEWNGGEYSKSSHSVTRSYSHSTKNVQYMKRPYNGESEQENKKKPMNIVLQIFLWLCFWYIMIFVVIIRSKKLSPTVKFILCAAIGIFFIWPLFTNDYSDAASPSDESVIVEETQEPIEVFYSIGDEVIYSSIKLTVTGFYVEHTEECDMLIFDYEFKNLLSERFYTDTTVKPKLKDDDGLIYDEDWETYRRHDTMPAVLEHEEKGIGRMGFKLENEVTRDLILSFYSTKFDFDFDVKYKIPLEDVLELLDAEETSPAD